MHLHTRSHTKCLLSVTVIDLVFDLTFAELVADLGTVFVHVERAVVGDADLTFAPLADVDLVFTERDVDEEAPFGLLVSGSSKSVM